MRNGVVERGDKGLMRAIDKFERGIAREVKRVIRETAELIVTQAKADAPYDMGNLKRSIDVEYSATGYTAVITVGSWDLLGVWDRNTCSWGRRKERPVGILEPSSWTLGVHSR